MKILIKLIKITGLIILLVSVVVGGFFGYELYKLNIRKKAELTFSSEQIWQWYDEDNRIQIFFNKKHNKSVLRKVYMHDKYVVYAYKDDDYKLITMIEFVTKCKPNSVIKTSKQYSDGKPVILRSNEKGNSLSYSVYWGKKNTQFVWQENVDGFKFRVNFSCWDFSKLDQEITLSKTKEAKQTPIYPYLQTLFCLSVGIPKNKFFESLQSENIKLKIIRKTDEYIVIKGHPFWDEMLLWDSNSAKTLVRVMKDGFIYSVSSGGSFSNKKDAQANFLMIKTKIQEKFKAWKIIESSENIFHVESPSGIHEVWCSYMPTGVDSQYVLSFSLRLTGKEISTKTLSDKIEVPRVNTYIAKIKKETKAMKLHLQNSYGTETVNNMIEEIKKNEAAQKKKYNL